MNGENINKIIPKIRILVAPLDWGLGHTTRCIPLIKTLIRANTEVILAARDAGAILLKKEFPNLVILPLKGYNIKYSRSKSLFVMKMLTQIPNIIHAFKVEHKWLSETVSRYNIDGVITDNRYGLFTRKVPCIFITHQLFIQTGNNFLNKLVQKVNYHFINKFDACWVPDAKGINNLAGKLSHPDLLPHVPVKYLGLLSRCKKSIAEKKTDLLIMISGPEPQRSIFEKIILKQLPEIEGKIVILRGLPESNLQLKNENTNLTIYNHLAADELNELIQQSTMVLARSGYSTIMDLVALRQKAILVATPGQTEQEYLADYLKEKRYFFTATQENFSLREVLEEVKHFKYVSPEILPAMDEMIVIDWLKKLST